jgi:hypothetical protein
VKPLLNVALAALLVLCSSTSWADDIDTTAGANVAENIASGTSTHVSDEPSTKITPLKKNTAAPFTGLLVPEARYVELLEAELSAKSLRGTLEAYKIKDQAMEQFIEKRLQRLADPPLWEDPKVALAVGLVVGVVATAAATFGTWTLSEAAR